MNSQSKVASIGKAGRGEKLSPYLHGRREWDERYGSLITRAKNWRAVAFIALAITFVALFGLVALSLKSKVVPYIVAVDGTGKVVSQGVATEASVADDRLIRAAIFEWIQNYRMVSSDAVVERVAIDKVYAMIASGSPAALKVTEAYRNSSPLSRSQTQVVSIEVHTVFATSPKSYEVDWTETTMSPQGAVLDTENYKSAITFTVHPPEDEALARINPLGIYVTDISVSKVI
jgi:type IV secretion system protein VirB5